MSRSGLSARYAGELRYGGHHAGVASNDKVVDISFVVPASHEGNQT